jgi:hypothetical protein
LAPRLSPRRTGFRWRSLLAAASETSAEPVTFSWPNMAQLGLIVLAGGKGSRMKVKIPKQFFVCRMMKFPFCTIRYTCFNCLFLPNGNPLSNTEMECNIATSHR